MDQRGRSMQGRPNLPLMFWDFLNRPREFSMEAMQSGPRGPLVDMVRSMPAMNQAALATAPIPVVGDLMGLAADARMYAQEPQTRTAGNFGLSALGMLPFVPNIAGMSKVVGEVPKRFTEIPGTDWDEAARLYAETGEAPIGRGHRLVRTKYHYEGMEPFESTDLYQGSENITGYSDFDDAKGLLAEDFGPRRKLDMVPPPAAPNEPRYFGPGRDDELLAAMREVGKDWSLRKGFGMVAVGDFNHFDQAILKGVGGDLYAKSAPVRRLLREKYGDTVVLYRAQDPGDFGRLIEGKVKPTLFAGDYAHALQHGGENTPLYKFEVPVDDVIVAVGDPGTNYAEFVIRNPDYPELPTEWKK